jgi:hypothetical protein
MTPYLPGEEESKPNLQGQVCPLCHKVQLTCVEEKARSVIVRTKHFCDVANGNAEIKVTYLKRKKES